MSWAYRIVSHPAVDEDGVCADIREVYFDDAGTILGVSDIPAAFLHFESEGDAPADSLRAQLQRALDAIEHPIVPMPAPAAAADMTKGPAEAEARAIAMAREEGATERDLATHRLAYQYLRAIQAADAAAAAGNIAQGNGE